MKSLHVLVGVLLAISFAGSGCSHSTSRPSGLQSDSLSQQSDFFQSWTNSREEESEGTFQVFRPSASMDFPTSWFRQVYEFNEDGSGEHLVLHPADAHYMDSMSWTSDGENPNVIHIKDSAGSHVISIEILELTSDLLRIRSLQ